MPRVRLLKVTKTLLIPPSGVYVAPTGVGHYRWAQDGEVVCQEAAPGPTATVAASP